MNFFDRIKLHVRNSNTTLEAMITEISNKKYTIDSYQGWHRRKIIPKADICLKIADHLNISVRYLITGEESENDILQARFLKYKYLLASLDTLPEEKFEMLKILVSTMSQKADFEKTQAKKTGAFQNKSRLL